MRLCTLFLALSLTLTSYAANFVVHTGEVKGSQTLNTAGDEGLIEVGGVISTAGVGVAMSAADQRLLNKGIISSGTIGINNSGGGARALITNSGTIASGGNGINSSGNDVIITNNGTLTTLGNTANGIDSSGLRAIITNNGTITTLGTTAHGISSKGLNTLITNSGSIITRANQSNAIEITNPNSSVTNSGTIITQGTLARGIFSNDINASILNSGTITTQGVNAHGIQSSGTNAIITNSGTIRSAQANAVFFQGANPTLNLLRGSNLQGPAVSVQVLNLSVETGLNLALTLTPASLGFASLGIGAPFVVVGNTIAVIDPTGLALQADVVADLSDTILNGIYRHRTAFPCQCCNRCECGFWVEALGSYRERNHDNCIGYHNWQGGFLAGYDRPFWCGDVGLFAGASFGKAVVDQSTQKTETDSYFGGLSYGTVWCKNFIGAALVAGYTRLDNDRFVMNNLSPGGVQTAHAKDNGFFISPEITGARQFRTCWLSPIVSGTLRYAGLFLGDYSEKGSATNLSVKNRNLHLLSLRGELGVPFSKSCRDFCWSAEPYIGLLGRFQVADKRVDAELLGQSLSFDPGGPRNLAAFLFGFRGEQDVGCFTLFLNLETSFDNHRSARILGEGGVGISF